MAADRPRPRQGAGAPGSRSAITCRATSRPPARAPSPCAKARRADRGFRRHAFSRQPDECPTANRQVPDTLDVAHAIRPHERLSQSQCRRHRRQRHFANDRPIAVFAGPCQMESRAHALEMATALKEICDRLGLGLVYKTSFDKANRTASRASAASASTARSPCSPRSARHWVCPSSPTCTRRSSARAGRGGRRAADPGLPLPADRSPHRRRQDRPRGQGQEGPVPGALGHEERGAKITGSGNPNVLVTERGASFGYNTLVVDMRSLPIMAEIGCPVIFDATHSVQQPGGQGTASGGDRRFVPVLGARGRRRRRRRPLHRDPRGPRPRPLRRPQHGAARPVRRPDARADGHRRGGEGTGSNLPSVGQLAERRGMAATISSPRPVEPPKDLSAPARSPVVAKAAVAGGTMIKLWLRGSAIAVLTATALLPVQEAAVARGGHSHGRMHGIAMPKAAVQPALAATPLAAAVPAAAVPASAAKAVVDDACGTAGPPRRQPRRRRSARRRPSCRRWRRCRRPSHPRP